MNWKGACIFLLVVDIIGVSTYAVWFHLSTREQNYFQIITNLDDYKTIYYEMERIDEGSGTKYSRSYTGNKMYGVSYGLYNIKINLNNETIFDTLYLYDKRYITLELFIVHNRVSSLEVSSMLRSLKEHSKFSV